MKILSLLRACLSENMNLFSFKTKRGGGRLSRLALPVVMVAMVLFSFWSVSEGLMYKLEQYNSVNAYFPIFVALVSIMTLMEGIYKSGNLLFSCKDDDLLFSLPIKKTTVLFVRIFKFYLFEVLYNSLFLLPAIVVYACHINVDWTYYLTSFLMLILLPVIPVVVSCVIGFFVTGISVGSRFKNILQIVLTSVLTIALLLFTSNFNNVASDIAHNTGAIGKTISNLYYPAAAYNTLATNFSFGALAIFIIVNVVVAAVLITLLSRFYFRINSRTKTIKIRKKVKTDYHFKVRRPMLSLIKKELGFFINTPVLVVNSCFGLLLYIIACIGLAWKMDDILAMFTQSATEVTIAPEQILAFLPAVVFGLVTVISLMTSITSSMVSLEGRTIETLKALPVKPATFLKAKIWTTLLIIWPFLLVGDLILFIRFDFGLIETLLILFATILMPVITEMIGLLMNLRYPKLTADNDAEVVKQSASSGIAVFLGLILGWAIIALMVYLLMGLSVPVVMAILSGVYVAIYLILTVILHKYGVKKWNKLSV